MITKITYNFFLISCLFSVLNINSQNSIITGIILNTENNPIENVSLNYNQIGTISNKNGFYILEIPSNKTVRIKFSHISYESIEINLNLKPGDKYIFNPVLNNEFEQIETVIIKSTNQISLEGVTTISPKVIKTIKGAQPGVENLLKTLPGVNISNELSSQYSVRGGNFD